MAQKRPMTGDPSEETGLDPQELVDAIVDAVAQLTPGQRRQLQRRLQLNGLFVPETLLTDQQRLTSAPALGTTLPAHYSLPPATDPLVNIRTGASGRSQNNAKSSFVAPQADEVPSDNQTVPLRDTATSISQPTDSPQKENNGQATRSTQSSPQKSTANTPNRTETNTPFRALPSVEIKPAPVEKRPYFAASSTGKRSKAAPYRSPISGKIVVGTPESGSAKEPDPHLMPPLPGQAPEQPLILVIERGSYMLRWPGEAPQRVRLTFKTQVTEQEAYYDTLIGLLETVEQRLRDLKAEIDTARLDIRSADRLFVQQMLGQIPCEDIMLQVRRNHALELLKRFEEWRLVHQS